MKNRITLLVLGAIAALAPSAMAQTASAPAPAASTPAAAPAAPAAPAPPSLSTVFTPSIVTQYMFRGVRLGGLSFEPSIEEDYGNWAVGVWSNIPISNRVPGQSDPEIDPYGSYKFTVNDSWSIQPGFTWYTYLHAPTNQGFYRMTFEPNIAANYTVGNLTLTPKVYYDVVLQGPTFEFDAAYTVPLKAQNTELDFAATVGTYTWDSSVNGASPKVKNSGNYWLLGVAMPFAVGKNGKITIGFAYTAGSSNDFEQAGAPTVTNTAAVGRGVGTLSYILTF